MFLLVAWGTSIKYRVLPLTGGLLCACFLIILQGNLLKLQTHQLFQSGQNTTINASVVSLFKQNIHGYESLIIVRSIGGEKSILFSNSKLKVYTPFPLKLGDTVELSVTLKPIYGKLNAAGFDKERVFFSRQIIASAHYVNGTSFRVHSPVSLRHQWFQEVTKSIENLKHSGLILALAFGYREAITENVWQGLQASGLLHLVAISGLHIGIAFGIGYWLGVVWRWFKPKWLWLPFVFGLSLAWSYSWLAGFSLPTQRAFIMCLLASLLILTQTRVSIPRYVLISLCLVLSINPFSVMSNSFWLSFSAVAAVLYCVVRMNYSPKSISGKLAYAIKLQVYVSLLLLPASALFLGGISPLSFFFNLMFLPWFSLVVVPLLFFALFVSIFLTSLNINAWWLVDAALWPVTWSSGYAEGHWLDISQEALYLLVLLASVLLFSFVLKRKAILTIGVLILFSTLTQSKDTSLTVDVLDVGHGLAVTLVKNDRAILYDTGTTWAGGDIAGAVIKPVLNKQGVFNLDGLIVSHFDSDHAGGYQSILQDFQPTWVRSSQKLKDHLPCIEGEVWYWQSVKFESVWPPNTSNRAYNPHSCVVKATEAHSDVSILLTGDIDALSEWLLIRKPEVLDSDIMLVPHHGSSTSSTERFIRAVSPKLAIASLAKGNRWGMPNLAVVNRYTSNGVKWVDTGESGQITIKLEGQSWSFTSLRDERWPSWYRQMLRKGVE
ncbi:DNA internalization-related competence protein ComEC/Rec2 [Vibrio sp. T187]|nr:DNA internalization-related competence protein ComEC/Rec2 [Vibrio sp. T187]